MPIFKHLEQGVFDYFFRSTTRNATKGIASEKILKI